MKSEFVGRGAKVPEVAFMAYAAGNHHVTGVWPAVSGWDIVAQF